MAPVKLTIEISANGYSHKLTDIDGNIIWSDLHIMENEGSSRLDRSSIDVFDCEALKNYEDLATAIDDLSFGPFGVAGALYKIQEDQ